jgi:DNA-binding GntR family transcriptional regulator
MHATRQSKRSDLSLATSSLEDVLELLDIRIGLETRALALAIPNMLEADFTTAEALLKAYDVERTAERWGELNWLFHKTLYAPCNRPSMLEMIDDNYGQVHRFVRLQVSLASGKRVPQRDHYDLLEACWVGDSTRATSLLKAHIMRTQDFLGAAARQQQHPHRDHRRSVSLASQAR